MIDVQEDIRKSSGKLIPHPLVIGAIDRDRYDIIAIHFIRAKKRGIDDKLLQGPWNRIGIHRTGIDSLRQQNPGQGDLRTDAIPIGTAMAKDNDGFARQLGKGTGKCGRFFEK